MYNTSNNDLWIEQVRNPVTYERVKRKLLKAYEIQGDIFYGSKEVYDRLQELGYTDLTYGMVNYLVNRNFLSKKVKERHPELDPNNPHGLVQLKSRGQFYDRYVNRKTTSKFVLVYYFENNEHTRFYGVSTSRLTKIYENFKSILQYLDKEDQDITHYTFQPETIVEVDGKLRLAFDAMDRAIFNYISENPDYEAYNIDLICYV